MVNVISKSEFFTTGTPDILERNTTFQRISFQFRMVKRSHPISSFINKELKILEAQFEEKLLKIPNLENLSIERVVDMLKEKRKEINIFDLFNERIQELILVIKLASRLRVRPQVSDKEVSKN